MNKKERRKALFSILSSKLKNKQLLIVDDIKLKEMKTKLAEVVFSKLPYEKNILLAMSEKNKVLYKSCSNLPYVKTILVDYLNTSDLLKYKTLILLKSSLGKLDSLVK
jgi:large subunit ribosomal protein L4